MLKNLFKKLFPPKRIHCADGYFDWKLSQRLSWEARSLILEARSVRFEYPDLSGPELVRLMYWGASGTKPVSNEQPHIEAPLVNSQAAFDNHFENVFSRNASKRSVFK